MNKRLLSVLLSAAMVASLLVGCAGGGTTATTQESEAEEPATEEQASAAEEAAAEGDETLTVWCWDPNFNIYAMKEAEKIYQKDHPNFKLDIQENVYSDIEQKLITAAEAGDYSTLPDIFLMQDYSYSKMVTNYPDIYTDLTDSGIDFSQFTAGKVSDSTVDGKHYGVPFDNGAVIFAIRTEKTVPMIMHIIHTFVSNARSPTNRIMTSAIAPAIMAIVHAWSIDILLIK